MWCSPLAKLNSPLATSLCEVTRSNSPLATSHGEVIQPNSPLATSLCEVKQHSPLATLLFWDIWLPVEADVPEYLVKQALTKSSTDKEQAVADLMLIAFYYLLRVGEYDG